MAEFKGFDKNFNLTGKVALITGSARGIGKAIAILFAEKGADIILVDIDNSVSEVADMITKMGGKALPLVYDITKAASVSEMVKKGVDRFGKIDILVNNAGTAVLDDAENLSEEGWDKTMDLNAKAPFLIAQAAGKVMIKNKYGKIINIASIADMVAIDKHAAYCASKAAVLLLTKVLALEWAEYGITANSISPGVTLTELGKKAWSGEVGETMKKLIPIGRFNDPQEIAAAALYLASDAANMVNGLDLVIDGGFVVK